MIHIKTHSFPEISSSIVPASWMLAYLVFKGIAEDNLQDAEKNWAHSDAAEEWYFYKDDKDSSFVAAFHTLYEELCVRVNITPSSSFIAEAQKESSLRDLLFVADSIVRIFESNESKILGYKPSTPYDYPSEAFAIYSDCRVITQLYNECLERESVTSDEERHFGYFSLDFLSSVHEKIQHYFVDEDACECVRFEDFCAALCLTKEVQHETEEGLVFKDYSHIKLTPQENSGMLMYAFLALMSGKRNTDCLDNPVLLNKYSDDGPPVYVVSEDESVDFFLPDSEYWSREFSKRIIWPDSYVIIEDQWKSCYHDQKQVNIIIEADHNNPVGDYVFLSEVLQRKVFSDICSQNNFDIIINCLPKELSIRDLLFLRTLGGEDKNALKHKYEELYSLLCKETDFLYRNKNHIAKAFENEASAKEFIQWHSKKHFLTQTTSDQRILQIYQTSQNDFQQCVNEVYSLFMERDDFKDANLWNQPCITNEMVDRYVSACILQDEQFKLTVLQKISELDVLKGVHTTDMSECQMSSAIEGLLKKGIIVRKDAQYIIQPRSKNGKGKQYKTRELVNYLVENNFVSPESGWQQGISNAKNNTLSSMIESDTRNYTRACLKSPDAFENGIRPLNNELNWRLYHKKFEHPLKGSLSSDDLKTEFLNNNNEAKRILFDKVRQYELRK